ncbi:MAG: hypothetical protein B6244_07965 [Candidatus Cloacimonetes bacterium 4572_55]|nr:MAG: hypothetical protein B6244_07965 [Candidatus Cloacimonetes bacterium 4572_55]
MSFVRFYPKRIYIERSMRDHPTVETVLNNRPQAEAIYVDDPDTIRINTPSGVNPITYRKKLLLLRRQKGSFFKKCPGIHDTICCNYYILNWANDCHLDCSYCFLQSYLNHSVAKIYVNTEDMLTELDHVFKKNPRSNYRVGTGEYADSLGWDDMTHLSDTLVPFFAHYPNALLELKTKSDQIDRLIRLNSVGNTVVSWSVNPPKIIREEEHKTASLAHRLRAARRCAEKGYKIAFHFDPMIHYLEWETGYKSVVDQIFDTIPIRQIAWISIGAFRFHPLLKEIVRTRFPKSKIFLGEFIPADHDKMRYFKPIRVQMYQKIRQWIADRDPNIFNHLCMETEDVWQKIYGFSPGCSADLNRMFDNRGILFTQNS